MTVALDRPIDAFVMMASDDLKPTRPMRIKKRSEIAPSSQVPDPKQPEFWKRVQKKLTPAEIKWRHLAKGHERPRKIFRNSEEAERRVAGAEFNMLSRSTPVKKWVELEDSNEEHREAVKEDTLYAAAASLGDKFMNLTLSWMDAQYVGETVRARLDGSKPVLVMFIASPFSGYFIKGAYHIGTNCIHTDCQNFVENTNMGTRVVKIAHELHHYASWLGGGMRIRWRDREGRPCFKKRPRRLRIFRDFKNERLNDVLTTTLSHKLAEDHGIEITYPDNPEEMMMGLMLEELTDGKELRRAYFSGDYTEVARRLDDRLGEGTFAKMLEKLDEGDLGIWCALAFIYDLINKRRIEAKDYWSRGIGGKIIEKREYYKRFIPHQYRDK